MPRTEPFLLRPENQKFLAGETRRLPGTPGLVHFLIPVLLAAVALGCFWWGRREWDRVQSFRRNGVTAQATVVGRRVSTSSGVPDVETGMMSSDDDYLVKYRFEALAPGGRRAVEREASVSRQDYDRWRPGAVVAVTYDPADPSFSRMQGEGEPRPHGFPVLAGTALLGGSALLGLFVLATWWRNRRLTRDGAKLEGRVVSCTRKEQKDGGVTLELEYRFVSPSGRVLVGTATTSRRAGAEPTLPAPESPVVVLYCSDRVYQLL
jgi:hypothetical protein